jgi:hypothetical protein
VPTDDLRRLDDQLLASLDKRLALLEQAQDLGAKAAEARSTSHDRAIETLRTEVKASLNAWQSSSAEPSASPAGRALLGDIAEVKIDVAAMGVKVDRHDELIQQFQGAIRLARFAIGTSALAAILQVIQLINMIGRPPGP